jgi:putative methionine-R-sulfoxide reductase with GAF domain
LRPGVTQEQQKAMDFFNRHNEEQKMVKDRHSMFQNKTKTFFNQEFKGFDFNIGEKRFRYGVSNTESVAKTQSDLTNFVGKFLNEKGEVKDYAGYHKAIYAAENADTIANHFYEQGKADAVKDVMAKSKNITNEPRTTSTGDVYINGLKVKAISGVDSSKLKLRIKNKNN